MVYFLDKISKKLFIFQGNGIVEESFQQYSQYLEIEKELRDVAAIEQNSKAATTTKTSNRTDKPKALKLTFNEKKMLAILPEEIEQLETQMQQLNNCLADPSCYEEKGITTLATELSDLEALYEQKVEALLDIEEKLEFIEKQSSESVV